MNGTSTISIVVRSLEIQLPQQSVTFFLKRRKYHFMKDQSEFSRPTRNSVCYSCPCAQNTSPLSSFTSLPSWIASRESLVLLRIQTAALEYIRQRERMQFLSKIPIDSSCSVSILLTLRLIGSTGTQTSFPSSASTIVECFLVLITILCWPLGTRRTAVTITASRWRRRWPVSI